MTIHGIDVAVSDVTMHDMYRYSKVYISSILNYLLKETFNPKMTMNKIFKEGAFTNKNIDRF